MKCITISAPPSKFASDAIPAFNVLESNLSKVGDYSRSQLNDSSDIWPPIPRDPDKQKQSEIVRTTWSKQGDAVGGDAVVAWAEAIGWSSTAVEGKAPSSLLEDADVFEMSYLFAPFLSFGA